VPSSVTLGDMESTLIPTEEKGQSETRRVLEWRLAQLRRGGFEPEDAALLASHLEVDLHEALALVRRGCPPKTALRILL
jgi:hypothetical protein